MNLSESHIFKRSKEISIKMDGWHAEMFYVDIFKGFFHIKQTDLQIGFSFFKTSFKYDQQNEWYGLAAVCLEPGDWNRCLQWE